jgi:hypothetical protein
MATLLAYLGSNYLKLSDRKQNDVPASNADSLQINLPSKQR